MWSHLIENSNKGNSNSFADISSLNNEVEVKYSKIIIIKKNNFDCTYQL